MRSLRRLLVAALFVVASVWPIVSAAEAQAQNADLVADELRHIRSVLEQAP